MLPVKGQDIIAAFPASGQRSGVPTSRYDIKLFDRVLATFEFEQDGPGPAFPCHLELDETVRGRGGFGSSGLNAR